MKVIQLIILLSIFSCTIAKEKSGNSINTNEAIIKTAPKNQLIVVLNDPKKLGEAKDLITNSGLKWMNLLMDNKASKIGVIEIPDGKLEEWKKRLYQSTIFKSITIHTETNAKKLIDREKNTWVSIRKTSCFGDCPIYNVFIDIKGNVVYEGKAFVLEKAVKKFKLTEKEINTLSQLLNKKDFSLFKDIYDNPRIKDLPNTFISYKDKQIQIRLWSDHVPEVLMELNEFIELLLVNKKFIQ